jgi:hypothetical protein
MHMVYLPSRAELSSGLAINVRSTTTLLLYDNAQLLHDVGNRSHPGILEIEAAALIDRVAYTCVMLSPIPTAPIPIDGYR